jgi:hypothetical protein
MAGAYCAPQSPVSSQLLLSEFRATTWTGITSAYMDLITNLLWQEVECHTGPSQITLPVPVLQRDLMQAKSALMLDSKSTIVIQLF